VIHLLELELSEAEPTLAAVTGHAWVLVRHHGRPVGDAWVWIAPDRSARVAEDLVERFAVTRFARGAVTAAPRGATAVAPDAVSVVVCTRDRPAFLEGCLKALAALAPAPAEVLVVDNAPSTTATAEVVERFGVRRVVEPVPGLDHARNRGWREARGEVVAFVDDDARPESSFVAMVAEGFVGERVGAVTGLVVPAELLFGAQAAFERIEGGMGKGYAPRLFGPGEAAVGLEPFRLGVGTNMAFRREALDVIGGFDPILDVGTRTRGGGDIDALWRTLRAGYAVFYQPAAVVRHVHRRERARPGGADAGLRHLVRGVGSSCGPGSRPGRRRRCGANACAGTWPAMCAGPSARCGARTCSSCAWPWPRPGAASGAGRP
jgi:GT2 family glycosyltransferase